MAAFILEDEADDRGVDCSSSNGNSPLGLTADNLDLDASGLVKAVGTMLEQQFFHLFCKRIRWDLL